MNQGYAARPGEIIDNDPDISDDELDEYEENDTEELERRKKQIEKNGEAPFDPVPGIDLRLIDAEFNKVKGFLGRHGLEVRAMPEIVFPRALWTDISKDLKTPTFIFKVIDESGKEVVKEFFDPTSLFKEMLNHMTEEDVQKALPKPRKGNPKFSELRLRGWDLLEAFIPGQGWYRLKVILKSYLRVPRSAKTWLESQQQNRGVIVPARRGRPPKAKTQILIRKPNIPQMNQYPMIQYGVQNPATTNDEIIQVKEDLERSIDNGLQTLDESREMAHGLIERFFEDGHWQKLSVAVKNLVQIDLKIKEPPKQKFVIRREKRSNVKNCRVSEIDSPIQKRKRPTVIPLSAISGIKKGGKSLQDFQKSDSEGEDVIQTNTKQKFHIVKPVK